MTKDLKTKWAEKKPSTEERNAYNRPHGYPLTSKSTLIDAIIHFTAARGKDQGANAEGPIETRYPFILEEVSRLASKEATELLQNTHTQELRKALSQVIKSFGSSPGFTWQWHDEFKLGSREDQLGGEKKEKISEDKEGMDPLLTDIMALDKVKEFIRATPSMGLEVQEIFEEAIKVTNYYHSFDID